MTTAPAISGYHAHVYYDAASKPRAARLRETVEARFDVVMGRWHDRPVGPHPMFSYQIAFRPEIFAEIVPFLALNRDGLTVFLHPETGNDVADHTAHAMWLGEQQPLDISALE